MHSPSSGEPGNRLDMIRTDNEVILLIFHIAIYSMILISNWRHKINIPMDDSSSSFSAQNNFHERFSSWLKMHQERI